MNLSKSISSTEELRLSSAFVGACAAGDQEMFDLLLPLMDAGPGINTTDLLGVTGLMAALGGGHLEVAEQLLEHKKIDLFVVKDRCGKCALDYMLETEGLYYVHEAMCRAEMDDEINMSLIRALLKCLEKDNLQRFKEILYHIGDFDNNHELIVKTLLSGKTAFIGQIMKHFRDDFDSNIKVDKFAREALVSALVNGFTYIIPHVFKTLSDSFAEILEKARSMIIDERTLSDQEISRALFPLLKDSKVDEKTFDKGLSLIDVNFQDEFGDTLLMKMLTNSKLGGASSEVSRRLARLTSILKVSNLQVNKRNNLNMSALDFINIVSSSTLSSREFFSSSVLLAPVQNGRTIKLAGLYEDEEKLIKELAEDVKILLLFQKRQDFFFHDVDFNSSREPLLFKALSLGRLDLVRFLLINVNLQLNARSVSSAIRMLSTVHVAVGRPSSRFYSAWEKGFQTALLHILEQIQERELKCRICNSLHPYT